MRAENEAAWKIRGGGGNNKLTGRGHKNTRVSHGAEAALLLRLLWRLRALLADGDEPGALDERGHVLLLELGVEYAHLLMLLPPAVRIPDRVQPLLPAWYLRARRCPRLFRNPEAEVLVIPPVAVPSLGGISVA